jgi:hypothetical protein
MSGTKGHSGGARVGSGKKKQVKTISEAAKKRWVVAARKFARDNGMTVEQAVLNMVVNPDVQDTVRVAAAKLYNEALIARVTEKNVAITEQRGPAIGLPERRKDPAKLRVVGGNSE